MEKSQSSKYTDQLMAFAVNFGATLVTTPAMLAAGYKLFQKKKFTSEYARLFKSGKMIGLAAGVGVVSALFERFIQHYSNTTSAYDREELDALREHVKAEGLTINYDGKTTLQKMDKNGDFHPISITELEDGSVLVKPTKTVTHSMRGAHAEKIAAEKAAATEATPSI
jgi:hypothetical protein